MFLLAKKLQALTKKKDQVTVSNLEKLSPVLNVQYNNANIINKYEKLN